MCLLKNEALVFLFCNLRTSVSRMPVAAGYMMWHITWGYNLLLALLDIYWLLICFVFHNSLGHCQVVCLFSLFFFFWTYQAFKSTDKRVKHAEVVTAGSCSPNAGIYFIAFSGKDNALKGHGCAIFTILEKKGIMVRLISGSLCTQNHRMLELIRCIFCRECPCSKSNL